MLSKQFSSHYTLFTLAKLVLQKKNFDRLDYTLRITSSPLEKFNHNMFTMFGNGLLKVFKMLNYLGANAKLIRITID